MAMRTNALGLVEVRGYLGAIAAADAALKAASVTCMGLEVIKGGLVTVKITGDVGAVQAAVEAGAETAEQLEVLLTRHVIARLHEETTAIVVKKDDEKVQTKQQSSAKITNGDHGDKVDQTVAAQTKGTQMKAEKVEAPAASHKKAVSSITDAVNETAASAQPEPAAATPGSQTLSLSGSKGDTSERPAQGAKKQTAGIKLVDLSAESAKEQAGSAGASSSSAKSKKLASKEPKRTRKTKKAGS